jgi:hypothetical protein
MCTGSVCLCVGPERRQKIDILLPAVSTSSSCLASGQTAKELGNSTISLHISSIHTPIPSSMRLNMQFLNVDDSSHAGVSLQSRATTVQCTFQSLAATTFGDLFHSSIRWQDGVVMCCRLPVSGDTRLLAANCEIGDQTPKGWSWPSGHARTGTRVI